LRSILPSFPESRYDRAADLAKSYAEHWEAEAMHEPTKGGGRLRRGETSRDWDATIKAGHWRIIEKEIRALARQPKSNDDRAG